jgi:hypothetical protein
MEDTNIELTRRKVEKQGIYWVYLTQDMEERQAVANPVMYLQTALRADSVLPSS